MLSFRIPKEIKNLLKKSGLQNNQPKRGWNTQIQLAISDSNLWPAFRGNDILGCNADLRFSFLGNFFDHKALADGARGWCRRRFGGLGIHGQRRWSSNRWSRWWGSSLRRCAGIINQFFDLYFCQIHADHMKNSLDLGTYRIDLFTIRELLQGL